MGVAKSEISWRTNYNLGEYGNFCSFAISGDRTPVFGIPGVQLTAVQKVVPIKPKISRKVDVNASEAIHVLTGVNEVRDKFKLTGMGIRVAVVDSGVDYKHPALGGGFGKGFTVGYGYDLVGDDYDGSDSSTKPDEDPMDACSSDSHGTHVAGIIAADTSRVQDDSLRPAIDFTGTAPGVEIGAYRVFSCSEQGGSGTDIIAAAIYKAAYDGSHIINLSLGGGPAYADGASAVACEKVGKMGHYCVSANGNDGQSGEYTAGDPGVSRGGFGIGSTDNSEVIQSFITVEGENYPVNFGSASSDPFPKSFSLADIVVSNKDAETKNILNDGVKISENVAGKIVLVRFGPSEMGGSKSRCDKVHEAQGIACILYGHTDEMAGIFGSAFIPSAFIARQAGLKIRAAIEAGKKVDATIYPEKVGTVISPTGGTLSDFSSHGLDLDLFIKPDITAIGGNVFSTISRNAANGSSPYSTYSGTSMATPNFAGILALYLEHQFRTSSGVDFDSIKARFQNTAIPMKIYKSDDIDTVAGQGAGLVNILKALTIESRVLPGSLSLNDTTRMQKSYTIQVYNDANITTEYTMSAMGASMVSPFAAWDDAVQVRSNTPYTAAYADVKFDETVFKLDPFESKQIEVQFTAPQTDDKWPIYSGYLVITSSRDEAMRVPYAGVIGDWNEAPIFARSSPDFDDFLKTQVTTGVFNENLELLTQANLTNGAIILPLMATNSRNVAIDLVPIDVDEEKFKLLKLDPKNLPSPFLYDMAGNPMGLFMGEMARNTAGVAQSVGNPNPFAWYGEVGYNSTLIPAGKYKIKFYGLKHFGQTDSKGDIDRTDASQFDVIIINRL